MNIQELLDLGDGVKELDDETLRVHLIKYFPQTRPVISTQTEEDDDDSIPEFLKQIIKAEKAKGPQDVDI